MKRKKAGWRSRSRLNFCERRRAGEKIDLGCVSGCMCNVHLVENELKKDLATAKVDHMWSEFRGSGNFLPQAHAVDMNDEIGMDDE